MLIQLADWKLAVDVPLTMELSAGQAKEHCECGYCRNFYSAVDDTYPALRPFLARFGLDIEGPDEFCPFEPTICEATYIVQGHILQRGMQSLRIDDVPLHIRSAAEAELHTEHPEPYFTLCVGLMELPWILQESMDEVVSPANEDEFLERMRTKLLQRLEADTLYS